MKLFYLDRSEYKEAQIIYKQNLLISFPIIRGVLTNLQEGEVIVDGDRDLFFAIHKFGFCQLFQRTQDPDKLQQFCGLISEPHFCEGRKLRWYNPNNVCLDYFLNSTKATSLLSERTQMRIKEAKTTGLCESPFEIASITADCLEKFTFDIDIGNRFWDSINDYIKCGIGVGAFDRDRCIGVCYSASLVENVAEIDVFVDERYRNSGIGKFLVNSFIQQCQQKNVTPNWDCFTNNIPSLSLANSMGFSSEYIYSFLTIYK